MVRMLLLMSTPTIMVYGDTDAATDHKDDCSTVPGVVPGAIFACFLALAIPIRRNLCWLE